ncbi:hypothetical protein PISMIDRAFT_682895, partial [Pisolithus microcarpus 441]
MLRAAYPFVTIPSEKRRSMLLLWYTPTNTFSEGEPQFRLYPMIDTWPSLELVT